MTDRGFSGRVLVSNGANSLSRSDRWLDQFQFLTVIFASIFGQSVLVSRDLRRIFVG